MPTDKISKFDVDDSIFTKNNPPTPNDVSAVAWLGSLSLEQVTDATYPINYEGSIGTEIASSIGLDSTFYYIKYFAYTVASGYGTMIAIPLQYNHIIPKFRTSDGTLWTDWTTGYLPLTGGTLSGGISLDKFLNMDVNHVARGRIANWGDGYTQVSALANDEVTQRYIAIGDPATIDMYKAARLIQTDGTYFIDCILYGEHNKPSGSYTGNGSAIERVIDIGGLSHSKNGSALLYVSETYSGYDAIIGTHGAIAWKVGDTSITKITGLDCNFRYGKLTLKTDIAVLNQNGSTFAYQVL